MESEKKTHRSKDIASNIIRSEDNHLDRCLKLYYKVDPGICVINIINYLKSNGWEKFNFNQYSVKKEQDNFVIILNYIEPKIFKK